MTGGDQHIVGPQRDLAIAPLAGEADALGDEPAADPEPARPGLDIEQAQFGDLLALLDEQHRTGDRTLALGDPAALARGVEILDEPGGDPRDQRLEGRIEAVLLGLEGAVAVDDPAHVARLVQAQYIGGAAVVPSRR